MRRLLRHLLYGVFGLLLSASPLLASEDLKPTYLSGTMFFGGSGMDGAYVDDMVAALKEAGIQNVQAADHRAWSRGHLVFDVLSVLFENNGQKDIGAFSGSGKEDNQLNLIGYSYGGLQAAHTALAIAENGGIVDNLALMATPIEARYLNELRGHENILSVKILDLVDHGDTLEAGGSDASFILSAFHMAASYYREKGRARSGHFFFSDLTPKGYERRRTLAKQLWQQGFR